MRPQHLIISFLILILCFANIPFANAQDFSNKGKDFWVGYGSHVSMYTNAGEPVSTGGSQDLVLYFTSDHDATVTVEIPALGYSKQYAVTANNVTSSDPIPKTGTQDARITAEGISDKGIHITSDYSIIAYAHIYDGSVSGATLLFPTNTLGRSYYSINYTQISNNNFSYCYAYVIATEDNTNVEIVLSASNVGGKKAGDTIKVALNKGQVYNVFGKLNTTTTGEDLTGTLIRSVATATSTCKRIAVFSGSGKVSIFDNNSKTADNYIQQAFPANAWGKKYLTVPTNKMPNNIFRVAVSDPTAIVKLNGQVLPVSGLKNNFYYEFQSNIANLIESNVPIMVAQYITTTGSYGNNNSGNGDPEMIYLSPIEQTISKVTINSTPYARISESLQFLNLTIHKDGVASLKVDGSSPSNPMVHPGDNNFVYYQVALKSGAHTIVSDSGFNAIAYGYGPTESYGYNAGTNVVDLYQKLTVNNDYGTVKLPATCKGTPFKISITLPYQPLSLAWSIPNNANIPVNNAPAYDSSYIINGKTIYRYTLNQSLIFDKEGTYNIQIKVNNPTGDGCSGEQTIDFDLVVYSPPKATFQINSTHCLGDPLLLSDNTTLGPDDRKLIAYNWKIGNGSFVNSKTLTYPTNVIGSIPIKYFVITDIGCLSDTASMDYIVDSIPKVNFNIQNIKCLGQDIAFKDSSFARGGTQLGSWVWNYGDKTATDSLTSNSLVTHKFDAAIKYDVNLKVTTVNGCAANKTNSIQINPIPKVAFSLPKICLSDAYAEFKDASTIADGSKGFKYLWDFGDPDNTKAVNSDEVASPKHKYINTGDYSVKETVTSLYGCSAELIQSFTVNGAYPKSKFEIISAQALCTNKPVALNNLSTVDIGNIGKLVIYWDYINKPQDSIIDDNPSVNKLYNHSYANFKYPDNMDFNVKLVAYSGGSCFDEVRSTISLVPPPQSFNVNPTKDYLCVADSITFNPVVTGGLPPFNFNWNTNNTAAKFNGNVLTGIDIGSVIVGLGVQDAKQCVYNYDNIKTFEIKDIPVATLKALDTIICNQDPIVLEGAGSDVYKWILNGILDTTTSANNYATAKPGFYKLQVNNGFCNSLPSNEIYIKQIIIPNNQFYSTNYVCINTPVKIRGNILDANGAHFSWDFGDSTFSAKTIPYAHIYTKKGFYQISLAYKNDFCPKYNNIVKGDTIKVVDPLKGAEYTMFVLPDIDTTLVNIKVDSGYTQYLWIPGNNLSNVFVKSPLFRASSTSDYKLIRTDTLSNCKIEDTYHIIVSDQIVVNIPKAFTPNNDGLNDVLKIEYGAGVKTFNYFKLFNRWGKLIFETNNVNGFWDGKFNGRDQDMDAYTYILDYTTYKDQHITKTGSVILIR